MQNTMESDEIYGRRFCSTYSAKPRNVVSTVLMNFLVHVAVDVTTQCGRGRLKTARSSRSLSNQSIVLERCSQESLVPPRP